MNNVTKCPDCGNENREGSRFCDSCGARIEPQAANVDSEFARIYSEDEGSSAPADEGNLAVDLIEKDEAAPADSQGELELAESTEPEGEVATGPSEAEDEGSAAPADEGEPPVDPVEGGDATPADSEAEPELGDSTEAGDDWLASSPEAEAEGGDVTPQAGYLVFPDGTEQPVSPSQWLIGRADLAKYLADPEKANEISRGHFTISQEGEGFFIEDGKTMVQDKPSSNKTWLVRGGSRILVTSTGRHDLQDADEIDVAELVRLQFVMK